MGVRVECGGGPTTIPTPTLNIKGGFERFWFPLWATLGHFLRFNDGHPIVIFTTNIRPIEIYDIFPSPRVDDPGNMATAQEGRACKCQSGECTSCGHHSALLKHAGLYSPI